MDTQTTNEMKTKEKDDFSTGYICNFNIVQLSSNIWQMKRNYMIFASSLQSLSELKGNTSRSCQSRGPRPPESTLMIQAKKQQKTEREKTK